MRLKRNDIVFHRDHGKVRIIDITWNRIWLPPGDYPRFEDHPCVSVEVLATGEKVRLETFKGFKKNE